MTFSGVTAMGFDRDLFAEELDPLVMRLSEITGFSQDRVLYQVFGELHFRFNQTDTNSYSCWSNLQCYGGSSPLENPNAKGLLIHELGHRFLNDLDITFAELDLSLGYYEDGKYIHVTGVNPKTWQYERTALGYPHPGHPYEQNRDYRSYKEDFADMFMNWALDQFTDDPAGQLRYEWIDAFIRSNLPYRRSKRSRSRLAKLMIAIR